MIEPLPPEYEAMPQLAEAWSRFAECHHDAAVALAATLAASDEVIPIRLDDGDLVGNLPVREFAERYARVTWSIRDFNTMNDGLGATINQFSGAGPAKRWVSAEARILPNGLLAFHAHGAAGLTYLALHETAHTTELGIRTNAECWASHRAQTPHLAWGQSNPWWLRNEKTANNIMRSIATRLNLATLAHPGAEFEPPEGDADLVFLDEITVLDLP